MNATSFIKCSVAAMAVLLLPANAVRAGGMPQTRVVDIASGAPADIRLTPVAESWPKGGFMPVRVVIANHAASDLSWSIQFSSVRNWREKMEFTQSFTAGAGTTLETVAWVPCLGHGAGSNSVQLSATVDGPGAERNATNLTNYNSNVSRQIACSASQEVDLYAAITAAEVASGKGGSGPGGGVGPGAFAGSSSTPTTELSVVDAAAWPADWRVWSPFSQVVMTDREFGAMDGARRAALMDWVALGGVLSLYPPHDGTQPDKTPAGTRWGMGVVHRLARSLHENQTVQPDDAMARYAVQGILAQARDEAIPDGEKDAYTLSRGSVGVVLFLVLFGILIGPVNLLFFAPPQRRQRLFVTVPLLSLAASGVLALVIVWRDGFGGSGAQHGVVLLLPGENKAVVIQDQLSRAGVLLSDRFALPGDTELLLPQDGFALTEMGSRERSFSRAPGEVSGSWFASRQRQRHELRRITPTRARVELVRGESIPVGAKSPAPVVQSSVSAALRDFRYRDAENKLWGADEVAPGQKVVLHALTDTPMNLPTGDFVGRAAVSELAPLATLSAIRWDQPVFYYTGRVEVRASTP